MELAPPKRRPQRCRLCGELGHNRARHSTEPRDRARRLALEADAERRARGIPLDAWNAAPPPPPTLAECEPGQGWPRPCPALRCRHHVGWSGSREYSCDHDVTRDHGAVSLTTVAVLIGRTRERVRQIETAAMERLRSKGIVLGERDCHA